MLTERILNYEAKPLSTIKTFYTNYKNMQNDKSHINSDKFYHAKANCEAGQFYDPINALILDFAKELNDLIQKNIFKRNGLTFEQNMQDSANDIQADYYGLTRGLLNPFLNCEKELDRGFLNGLNKID